MVTASAVDTGRLNLDPDRHSAGRVLPLTVPMVGLPTFYRDDHCSGRSDRKSRKDSQPQSETFYFLSFLILDDVFKACQAVSTTGPQRGLTDGLRKHIVRWGATKDLIGADLKVNTVQYDSGVEEAFSELKVLREFWKNSKVFSPRIRCATSTECG